MKLLDGASTPVTVTNEQYSPVETGTKKSVVGNGYSSGDRE
jgi:hypothetical protein